MNKDLIGSYYVVAGLGEDRLFAALKSRGTAQPITYLLSLRQNTRDERNISGDPFTVSLLVNQIKSFNEEGQRGIWKIRGVAQLPDRNVPVEALVDCTQLQVVGTLRSISKKRCSNCLSATHSVEERCKRCGNKFEVVQTYDLRRA